MKALVTGANGLLGANLLRALLRKGHEAVGLVRASSDTQHISPLPVSLSIGDVRDMASLHAPMTG